MEDARCDDCTWFVPVIDENNEYDSGECRVNAPVIEGFPIISYECYCGEFEHYENIGEE